MFAKNNSKEPNLYLSIELFRQSIFRWSTLQELTIALSEIFLSPKSYNHFEPKFTHTVVTQFAAN